jgi:short subunit dehydrogenase-like uncharacterized protein
MGFEFASGNLAAALALRDAGPTATRLEVGYFVTGSLTKHGLSGGTLASLSSIMFDSSFARHGGVVPGERAGRRQRSFDLLDGQRTGLSLGGSEHFALPQSYPMLSDVDVYLGWTGRGASGFNALSRTGGGLLALRPVKRIGHALGQRLFHGSTGGPDEQNRASLGTVVVAETFDARGKALARAAVEGISPYDVTARILAWAADRAANVGIRGVGAVGPVAAFGLDALAEGCRQAGIERVE